MGGVGLDRAQQRRERCVDCAKRVRLAPQVGIDDTPMACDRGLAEVVGEKVRFADLAWSEDGQRAPWRIGQQACVVRAASGRGNRQGSWSMSIPFHVYRKFPRIRKNLETRRASEARARAGQGRRVGAVDQANACATRSRCDGPARPARAATSSAARPPCSQAAMTAVRNNPGPLCPSSTPASCSSAVASRAAS